MRLFSLGLVVVAACGATGTDEAQDVTAERGDVGQPTTLPRPLQPASARGAVRTGDFLVTASAQYRGLQVYRVFRDVLLLVDDLVTDEEPQNLKAQGDRAYATTGRQRSVLVFDLSSPGRPRALPSIPTHGIARDVAPFAQDGRRYLAVAESPDGVRLLDVTDARHAVDLGLTDPSGGADSDPRAVRVQGSLLAVADAPIGQVALYSVADPAHPEKVGSIALPREPIDLAFGGDILYASLGFYGIDSFNVADPSTPVAVAHADGPRGPCGFNCQDNFVTLSLDGDRLYAPELAGGVSSYALDGQGGMELADVLPADNAFIAVPDGDRVFVGAEEGVRVFGRDGSQRFLTPFGHGTVTSLSLSHDSEFLYAAASVRGIETFATLVPFLPILVDRASTPGTRGELDVRAAEVLAAPGAVFVGDGRAGFTAFSARVPFHLVEKGSAPSHDRVEALQRDGNIVYACHGNAGVTVYDVSTLSAPAEIGELDLEPAGTGCFSLLLDGHILYVGGFNDMGVADVTDPRHPVLLRQVGPSLEHVVAIARNGQALYTVNVLEGKAFPRGAQTTVVAYDISHPDTPRLVSTSDDLGGTPFRDAIVLDGKTAYVAAEDAGIRVFDVSSPLHPSLSGTIATPGSALALQLGDGVLYVGQGEGGLGVVRLKGKHRY